MKAAPHIYTLTGNLLAERTLEFATWAPGKTQRATSESFQVGGKGINVSKMLSRLRVANTALCFVGGTAGAECEDWLRTHNFNFRSFLCEENTRTGTVVRCAQQPETTFLGQDRAPSASALAACADFLNAQPDGQILALCGSFPGWAHSNFDPVREMLERWMQRGILIADTYGPSLRWVSERPLALAKINATEFRTLAEDVDSIATSLDTLAPRWPVARWVISDGPGQVIFREERRAAEILRPPVVKEVSATGSGDVLFACLIDSLFVQRTSLRQALERALPLAAANAAHAGVAEFPEPVA